MTDPAKASAVEALTDLMIEVSEHVYFASWMEILEFELWGAMQGEPLNGAYKPIKSGVLPRLRRMSEALGGWVKWDDTEGGPIFVGIDQWLTEYKGWIDKQKRDNK